MERGPRSSRRPHAWQSVTNMALSSAAGYHQDNRRSGETPSAELIRSRAAGTAVLGHPAAGRRCSRWSTPAPSAPPRCTWATPSRRSASRWPASSGPVGAPLLDRPGGPRRVRLTPVGESLVVHARAVVARLHAAQADIAALRAGSTGTPAGRRPCRASAPRCCRGCSAGSATSGPASRWSRRRPSTYAELARAVESGRFDLSFAPLPVAGGPVRGPPGPRRPVRPAGPRGRPGGGQHVGDACARSARLPLIGFTDPDLQRGAGPPPAPHRARPDVRVPVQRQPDRAGLRRRRPGLRPDAAADRRRGRPARSPSSPRDRAAGPAARRHLARRPPAAAVGAPLHRAGGRGLRRPQP